MGIEAAPLEAGSASIDRLVSLTGKKARCRTPEPSVGRVTEFSVTSSLDSKERQE
jgi:hypothetical protein